MTVEVSSGYLHNGVHILPVRVYYEDTDFAGMVYHANYLRYMERGRTDCLRSLGIRHSELKEAGAGLTWTVTHMDIDFKQPARMDDALEVHTAFAKATGARLFAEQAVKRDGEDLVRARVEAACVRADGRPARIPGAIHKILTLNLATLNSGRG